VLSKIDSLLSESNSIWKNSGPFDENLRLIEEACDIANKNGVWYKKVLALHLLSVVHTFANNEEQIVKFADSSLVVGLKYLGCKDNLMSSVYINNARILRSKRKYRESNLLATKALENCINPGISAIANLNIIRAENLLYVGDYAKAKSVLELLIADRKNHPDFINDYAWFEAYYLLSKISAEIKNDDEVTSNIIAAEKVTDMFVGVNEQYKESEKLNIWTYAAGYFVEQENLPRCRFYLSLIKDSEYVLSPHQEAEYLSILARLMHLNGIESDSLNFLIKNSNRLLNQKSIEHNAYINKCQNLKFLGDVYQDEMRFSDAVEYYKAALDSLRVDWSSDSPSEIVDKEDVIKVMSSLFETHYLNNDAHNGRLVLEKLLDIIRYFIIENNNDSHIEFWAQENIEVLEKGLRFAHQNNDHELVFRIIEENKSNLLVKDMIAHKLRSSKGDENSYIQKEKEIISEITRLRRELIDAPSSEMKNTINEEIAVQELKFEELNGKLEGSDQDYYNLKYNLNRLDLPTLQHSLSNDECVVEFFIGEEDVYEMFISASDVQLIKAKDPKGLKSLIKEFVRKHTSNDENYVIDSLSKALYKNLRLDEIASFLPSCKSIKFIPDDYLSNISFAQLIDQEGRYLVDDYTIDYQYSAFLNNTLMQREVDSVKFNLLGYAYQNENQLVSDSRSCTSTALTSLLCSEDEMNSIQSILNDNKNHIIYNKQGFEQNCSDARIIHLATHACVDTEDSENSRLYFGKDFLTTYDLKLLKLNAELVVLSACETGYGDIVKGEGSMSISKAFLQAGAKSALVSLWPVDDCQTSNLMGLFYKHLYSGLDKDDALRNAQLEYIHTANPEFTTPYYWAGFIIVGDTSPLWEKSNIIFTYGALFILILISAVAYYIFSKKTKPND
jgi:CHAT domain-containing protein